jgi:hypothetical protein
LTRASRRTAQLDQARSASFPNNQRIFQLFN